MLSIVDRKVIKKISETLEVDKNYINGLYGKIKEDCLGYISTIYGDTKPEKRFGGYTADEKFELIEKTYKIKINYGNRERFIQRVLGPCDFSRSK